MKEISMLYLSSHFVTHLYVKIVISIQILTDNFLLIGWTQNTHLKDRTLYENTIKSLHGGWRRRKVCVSERTFVEYAKSTISKTRKWLLGIVKYYMFAIHCAHPVSGMVNFTGSANRVTQFGFPTKKSL